MHDCRTDHAWDCLPPAEQEKVVNFARQLPDSKPLSGSELTALAQRMVDATDLMTAQRLKADLVKGFYGSEWCRNYGVTSWLAHWLSIWLNARWEGKSPSLK
jgi:hypothetical protein